MESGFFHEEKKACTCARIHLLFLQTLHLKSGGSSSACAAGNPNVMLLPLIFH